MSESTPGPWIWYANGRVIMLVADRSMRPTVMQFERLGMHGAGPMFNVNGIMESAVPMIIRPQSHNPWLGIGIDHPDARLIAAAPQLRDALRALGAETSEGRCWCPGGPDAEGHHPQCVQAAAALRSAGATDIDVSRP